MLSAKPLSRASYSPRTFAMFFSMAASSASADASFSFAKREASALPMRARTSSARSSGRRTRRAPMLATCVSKSAGRRLKCLQLGQFLEQHLIRRFVNTNSSFNRTDFAFAKVRPMFRVIAALNDRFLFYLELCHRFALLFRVRHPLFLDMLNSLF